MQDQIYDLGNNGATVNGNPATMVLDVREINLKNPIGTDKYNKFQPTSTMTVMTDRFGNLVSATPGKIK